MRTFKRGLYSIVGLFALFVAAGMYAQWSKDEGRQGPTGPQIRARTLMQDGYPAGREPYRRMIHPTGRAAYFPIGKIARMQSIGWRLAPRLRDGAGD